MTDVQVRVEPSTGIDNDELDHVVCSRLSPDRALCGADVTDVPYADDGDVDKPEVCVVCVDLHDSAPGCCPVTRRRCDC